MHEILSNDWVKDKKLTTANSAMFGNTIFYIAKKNMQEKASPLLYWAYLYPQGITVMCKSDKDDLLKWLEDNIVKIENQIKDRKLL